MSRSLTEIYNEAITHRNKYLELTEVTNDSKMSVLNAFTWVTSALIYSFENILDVFEADVAEAISNRVNGTPAYYINALYKYQSGDDLIVNADGTGFSYDNINESKRIITKASYEEIENLEFRDKILLLKVATGSSSNLKQVSAEELIRLQSYIDQIKFAGTRIKVVSRNGDVLIPRVTVYYDGNVTKDEVYTDIENKLNDFIINLPFNSSVHSSQVIDVLQSVKHVTDVYINPEAATNQGIFIAKYDDDGNLGEPINILRYTKTNSGYLKQSSKNGVEKDLPKWRESITLLLEDK